MYDDAYTRNNDGELAVRTVSTTGDTGTNVNDVYTRDANGKLCLRVTGSGGGGGGDQHNLGYYATQAALEEAHPTAEAGDWAIVGATDTVWIWDTDNSEWVDSDQKGQVTSVNGRTGAVTVSEVPSMTGYSGRVLGTDGEVAGWIVPEKVQRSTMPQASEEEAGNIYQYVGPSGVYIDGHFYRCTPITSDPTVAIAQTTGSSLSDLSVEPYAFEDAYISQQWGPAEGGEVYFTAFVQTGTRWFDSALPAGVSITGNLESFFTAKGVSVEEGSAGSIMIIPNVSVNINVYNPSGSSSTIPTTIEELASYGVIVTNPDNVFVFCQFRYFTGTESGWVYGDGVNTYVDMAEVGISYEGTPVDGDVITCVYTPGQVESYEWFDIKVQDESVITVNEKTGSVVLDAFDVGATPQYTFMPMADEEHYDHIVQFIGVTDANYTNGYFYKCVSDGQDPATYSWSQVSVQPAPSGLPDQTGQSGKFLTTDGTDASWSDKPLINRATGDNGLIILGSSNSYSLSGRSITVVGAGANGFSEGSIVIGKSASVGLSSSGSVAIGKNAATNAANAIQLGSSTNAVTATNSDANTFKVANANGNFEIMSADGTVPTARLTKVNTTATLAVADWSSSTQTVSINGVTSTSVVFVAPDPSDAADYAAAGILCTSQGTNSLTFTATTTPTNDIDVNIVCL